MKKVKSKKKKINLATIYILLITFIVTLISVGYSTFSQDLIFKDMFAQIRVQKDIRIKSLSINSYSQNTNIRYDEYNVKNISAGIDLPYEDSYVIFDVGIVNLSNIEMGIKEITGLNENLKYEIVSNNYKMKGVLCDDNNNNKCKLGTETHILLKISYKDSNSYNQNQIFYPLNLDFTFDRVYKITYGGSIKKYLTEPKESHIMNEETLQIGLTYNNVNNLAIIEGNRYLNPDIDYTLSNNLLTIANVTDELAIDLNTITNGGLTISTQWTDNYNVEISLDGTATQDAYIRIRKGDSFITGNKDLLYDDYYASYPLFTTNQNVFIEYTYISGNYTYGTGAVTVKYRDTLTSCNAINTAELIANFRTQNFTLSGHKKNTGQLTTNVSEISLYIAKGNSFDNLKFSITYGIDT